MEAHVRNHALGNMNGWTSQLAWFRFRRCIVGLKTHIILALTLLSSPFPEKIVQKTLQGATRQLRTLPLPNFARCDTTTSHPATLSHHTLQHRAITPCHFLLSHRATQKARFLPPKSTLPDPFPAVGVDVSGISKPGISDPFGMRRSPHSSFLIDIRFLQYSSQSGSSFCMTQLESGSSFCCIRGKSNSFSFTQRIDIRNQILYYIAQTKSYYGF